MDAMAQLNKEDMAALTEQFIQYIEDSVVRLGEMALQISPGTLLERDVSDEVFGIAHNIKGMGTTFGYDLLTSIGESLCDYGKKTDPSGNVSSNVVLGHIKAIQLVFDHRISGTGGIKGQELLDSLHQIVTEDL